MLAPNLFSFATSELSQDAFICWLAAWADPKYKKVAPALHATGQHFIKSMFAEAGKTPPTSIASVTIHRQFKHIDVLIVISDTYVLLIEDKINTFAHSGQLERYAKEVSKNFIPKNIVKIFLKTGDQASYVKEQNQGYVAFTRRHFLRVLQKGKKDGVTNDIFEAFLCRLQEIEDSFNSYSHLPLEKWSQKSWAGFYTNLQLLLKDYNSSWNCHWKKVDNKSGGFMGCWSTTSPAKKPYWQFEHSALTIKIHEPEKNKQTVTRTKWYSAIIEAAANYNAPFIKPRKFGCGQWMTVALRKDGIVFNQNNQIDMEQTLNQVIEAQSVIQHAIEMQAKNQTS